jgi:N-acylneuraminate cytidylyltransferase
MVAEKYGAEVIKRPKYLAEDTTTSEAVLLHVLDYLEKVEKYHPDLLIFLQCTSPLRQENDIDKAIAVFLEQKADSLFSVFRFNKYIWDVKDGMLRSLNFNYKKERWKEQDFPIQYQENGSIYVLKPDILRKAKSRFGGKLAVYEMDCGYSLQIDTPEDFRLLEYMVKCKKGK